MREVLFAISLPSSALLRAQGDEPILRSTQYGPETELSYG
jgi:hypothetical protein